MIKMLSPPMHVFFSARDDMSIAGKNDNEIKNIRIQQGFLVLRVVAIVS